MTDVEMTSTVTDNHDRKQKLELILNANRTDIEPIFHFRLAYHLNEIRIRGWKSDLKMGSWFLWSKNISTKKY